MINLLPPEGKKLYVQEYWVRVLSVWGFLMGAVLVGSTLLFIPSYTLIYVQLRAAGEAIETAKSQSDVSEKENVIREANVIIDQLSLKKEYTEVSQVIEDMAAEATEELSINHFNFSYKDDTVVGAQIQGAALSREALAQFKRSLEALPYFASVTLPISDLAREKDLPFTITVTFTGGETKKP